MTIAVASGKGGTGKTTIATNLAVIASEKYDRVTLLDCDVEEPNSHIFINGEKVNEEIVNVKIPEVDESLCTECGACSDFCQYNAIVSLKGKPVVFKEMCHSCGGCSLVCQPKAIHEVDHRIGVINFYKSGKISLIEGLLDVGSPLSPPLIGAVKKHENKEELNIIDAPPGTSCPVIEAIRDADYIILVTEPTPFGLNDLILAVEVSRKLNKRFAVAINRVGSGDDRVHKYCKKENIPIILEIPDDRKIAELYSNGKIILGNLPEYKKSFEEVLEKIGMVIQNEQ
ncbi:Cobyrinic acid ac-diamide synthase [Thermodesulfobium narugense DSM 14796]|uniref:Cobyrinic acid ac-diamide synthase n=1 Tax=Thermodesulfobium narugense DSM 14796 TaxID=747365 RepID=M1E7G4_9BACT|nr:ATP-binding protein [Thermodesulfobium narugense]AEE15261.1 Cobyrinic acid ac-diamide synthase [Thermodesulfobium narugense DSM 14796]